MDNFLYSHHLLVYGFIDSVKINYSFVSISLHNRQFARVQFESPFPLWVIILKSDSPCDNLVVGFYCSQIKSFQNTLVWFKRPQAKGRHGLKSHLISQPLMMLSISMQGHEVVIFM